MTQGPHVFAECGRDASKATIDGDDARHLLRVLRVRRGDAISLSDGRGTVWQATVTQTKAESLQVALEDPAVVAPPAPRLVVVHALPKQRKLDDVIQRLTEVGVDEIRPVHSERSEVRLDSPRAARAVARWRAVAYAAAKQSRRAWLPTIADVGTWDTAFDRVQCGVTFWEESAVPLRSVLDRWTSCADVVIGVGPEGGLTADEVDSSGLPHATMGATVLRTDTAALVAVAAIRYHLGLMAR